MSAAANLYEKEAPQLSLWSFMMLALPIFPGRLQPSIVSRSELNYCVRNGNRWTLTLISTNSIVIRSSGKQALLYCTRCNLSRPFQSFHLKPAQCLRKNGDPYRIRTDVKGVRGLCLNHLTNGPYQPFPAGVPLPGTPASPAWCAFRDSNPGPTD